MTRIAPASWVINEAEYKAILEGALRLAPTTSKCPHRAPFTTDILCFLHNTLDRDNPCNAAIFACLTLSFFCLVRFREFTVPTIKSFDPACHITRARYQLLHNHDNLLIMVFHLPSVTRGDFHLYLTVSGLTFTTIRFPISFLLLTIFPSSLGLSLHLYYRSRLGVPWTLLPQSVADTIHQMHTRRRDDSVGMLFYLLNNIPFDIVKMMGWWSGESFTLYLCHHALVLAPFLQSKPDTITSLRNYILLLVC
ncbi:hypothetical protein EDC04DRAFT_2581145 [Pisolithus marmoratus]|nr:hypothetical protein EDC04DRAFT_2581145 [Pisolithus marmoratus]